MPESINEKSKDVTSARESGTRENSGKSDKAAGGDQTSSEQKTGQARSKPKK